MTNNAPEVISIGRGVWQRCLNKNTDAGGQTGRGWCKAYNRVFMRPVVQGVVICPQCGDERQEVVVAKCVNLACPKGRLITFASREEVGDCEGCQCPLQLDDRLSTLRVG